MATAQATLTPVADTTPATVSIPAKELSGAQWVARFPGSASLSDLESSFSAKVKAFISAMELAGGSVAISATFRPKERAYLMHYCVKIAKKNIAAADVPELEGVAINWVHPTDEQSVAAAKAMKEGYNIAYPPAYPTHHSDKLAIDMTITNILSKTMKDANGIDVEIKSDTDLHKVGASYGVIKLVVDAPHWSDNGH
jgi:hypothetical protein